MINLTIEGDRALLAKIRTATAEVTAALEEAVDETTTLVTRDAKANAPVDTGALRKDIRSRRPAPLVGEVVTDLPYSRRIEFGFVASTLISEHNRTITQVFGRPIAPKTIRISEHWVTYNQAGQFYMTRAADGQRPQFLKRASAAVGAALR